MADRRARARHSPRRRSVALALASGWLIATGCAKVLGVDGFVTARPSAGADASDGGSGRCGGFHAPPSCESCVRGQCCEPAERCRHDPDCERWASCSGQCAIDDAECRARCSSGVQKTRAVRDYGRCLFASCGSECLRCGDLVGDFGPDCARCMSGPSNGCKEGEKCLASTECRAFMGCMVGECESWDEDPACRMSCSAEHPGARDLFVAWAVNPASNCSTECGWGTHWNCTHFPLPTGNGTVGAEAEVRLHVDASAAGATIRHCLNFPPECTGPALTSDGGTGVVTFRLLPTFVVDTDYFEVKSPAHDYYTLFYPSRTWIGTVADVGVPGDQGAPETPDPGTGWVAAAMGDCVGSVDVVTLAESGATLELDDVPSVKYAGPGGRKSGAIAYFNSVPPGLHQISGFNPDHSKVATREIRVRAGDLTFVYLNFPVFEQ